MAAKKAPAKAPAKRSKKAANPEDVLPKLAQEELLKLRLLDAQAKIAAQDANMAMMEKVALLNKLDPEGLLRACDLRFARSRENEGSVRKEYQDVLAKISTRVGVDLTSGCTIDPETGTIIQHEKKE